MSWKTDMEENFVILTGLVVSTDRNANTKECKRPVLDIEIIRHIGTDLMLETVPVLVNDIYLAKTILGYEPGDILVVQGLLRSSNGHMYVEATGIEKRWDIGKDREFAVEFMASKLQLLNTSPRFNLVTVIGTVKEVRQDRFLLEVERNRFPNGDLKDTDQLLIFTQKAKLLKNKESLLVIGELGNTGMPGIYPGSIHKLK